MGRKFGDSKSGKSFSLRSGNKAPAFKMMGSSPIRQGLTDEKVVNVDNISDRKSELLHRQQVAAARKEYRSNMPIVHKGDKNTKKRNKFIADYMSKFEPPTYVPPEKKVITTSSTTPKVKPQSTTEVPFDKGKPPSYSERLMHWGVNEDQMDSKRREQVTAWYAGGKGEHEQDPRFGQTEEDFYRKDYDASKFIYVDPGKR